MKWFIGSDIGIDLGTATTLIYIKGKGIVLNEPTVVAIEQSTNKSIAIGLEAKRMLGRTPNSIRAIRPMKDGVIADFEMVEELIRILLTKVQARRLFIRPKVVVSVPSGITAVERRAVRDSIEHAGAREVYLVPEPLAAAIGVGLPIEAPLGNMLIDVGGGTTEIAVIALSGIVRNVSVRVAGDEMNDAIVQYLKKRYNLLIGESTAEEVKITIGSILPTSSEEEMQVKGIDLVAGLPKTVKINSGEMRSALHEPLGRIITSVRDALEKTPPELASDIVESGIVMTGGGSLLRGLPETISKETGLPVKLAESPVECVVKGTGKILDSFEHYYKILSKGGKEG
jgi:rod shape-determining protein MreB